MKIIGKAMQVQEGDTVREVITFGDVATITRVTIDRPRPGNTNYDVHRIAKGDCAVVVRDTIEVSGDAQRLATAIAAAMPAYADLPGRMNFNHESAGEFGRLYEAAKFVAAGVRDYRGKARKATPLEF